MAAAVAVTTYIQQQVRGEGRRDRGKGVGWGGFMEK